MSLSEDEIRRIVREEVKRLIAEERAPQELSPIRKMQLAALGEAVPERARASDGFARNDLRLADEMLARNKASEIGARPNETQSGIALAQRRAKHG